MRRFAFAFGLAAALAVTTAASLRAQDVVLGVKGGVNVSDFSVDDPEDTETDTEAGLVGGVFGSFGLGQLFAFRPEVLFSQKGAEAQNVEGQGADVEFSLDYLEIPVLLAARAPTGLVRPSVYAGPVLSFETSCEVEAEVGEVEESLDCDDPDADAFGRKETDFGVAFGGGLEIGSGPAVFLLDGRYTLGLTDIDDSSEDTEVKNRALSFMAGVGIKLR